MEAEEDVLEYEFYKEDERSGLSLPKHLTPISVIKDLPSTDILDFMETDIIDLLPEMQPGKRKIDANHLNMDILETIPGNETMKCNAQFTASTPQVNKKTQNHCNKNNAKKQFSNVSVLDNVITNVDVGHKDRSLLDKENSDHNFTNISSSYSEADILEIISINDATNLAKRGTCGVSVGFGNVQCDDSESTDSLENVSVENLTNLTGDHADISTLKDSDAEKNNCDKVFENSLLGTDSLLGWAKDTSEDIIAKLPVCSNMCESFSANKVCKAGNSVPCSGLVRSDPSADISTDFLCNDALENTHKVADHEKTLTQSYYSVRELNNAVKRIKPFSPDEHWFWLKVVQEIKVKKVPDSSFSCEKEATALHCMWVLSKAGVSVVNGLHNETLYRAVVSLSKLQPTKQEVYALHEAEEHSINFSFSKTVWNDIQKYVKNHGALHVGPWKDYILKQLKKTNDVCHFTFVRQYVSKRRRTFVSFTCYGICSRCKLRFKLQMKGKATLPTTIKFASSKNSTCQVAPLTTALNKSILKEEMSGSKKLNKSIFLTKGLKTKK
ncbi:unnamed protein product [Clavelina lepadiformis]|uniref:Uncharacterized protein n=1 Tax=Clavelina lepadiformis TaxID=159417 RepID=A0ABP0F4Y7_CLALP